MGEGVLGSGGDWSEGCSLGLGLGLVLWEIGGTETDVGSGGGDRKWCGVRLVRDCEGIVGNAGGKGICGTGVNDPLPFENPYPIILVWGFLDVDVLEVDGW